MVGDEIITKEVMEDLKDWAKQAAVAGDKTVTLTLTARKGMYTGGQLVIDKRGGMGQKLLDGSS